MIARLVLLATFLCTGALAKDDNTYYASNNEKISLILSQKEVNRINFVNDIIESLHYSEGEIEYNPVDGDLYLKLKAEKPINFFLKTEKGRTYQFLIVPSDIPSVQAFIKPKIIAPKAHVTNGLIKPIQKVATNYDKSISKIIQVADTQKEYMGFELSYFNKKVKCVQKGLDAKLILTAADNQMRASKIILQNVSKNMLIIDVLGFESPKTIATYAPVMKLNPGESTVMIIVDKL